MRRIGSFLLAACMIAGCLAGCGQTREPSSADNSQRLEAPVVPNRTATSLDPTELEALESYRVVEGSDQTAGSDILNNAQASTLRSFTQTTMAGAFTERIGWNVFYSPAASFSALSAGTASGASKAQSLLNVLSLSSTEMLDLSQTYLAWQPSAVSIWADTGKLSLTSAEAINQLALGYHADVYELPILNDTAVEYMKSWVCDNTVFAAGIEDYDVDLNVDSAADSMVLSVVDATTTFAKKFPDSANMRFLNGSGELTSAAFMLGMIDECDYKEEISFKLARVETDDGDMIFVLPVGSSSIRSIMSDAAFLDELDDFDSSHESGAVNWAIPKVQVDSALHYMTVDQFIRLNFDNNGINSDVQPAESYGRQSSDKSAFDMSLTEPFGCVARDSAGNIRFAGIVNYV